MYGIITCELVVQSTCYFAQRCLIPSEILFLILVTPFLFLCFYFFADEVLSDLARVRISSFCFYILQSDIYFQRIFKIKTNVQCKANMEKPIRPGKHKIIWLGGITPPSCKISWLFINYTYFFYEKLVKGPSTECFLIFLYFQYWKFLTWFLKFTSKLTLGFSFLWWGKSVHKARKALYKLGIS